MAICSIPPATPANAHTIIVGDPTTGENSGVVAGLDIKPGSRLKPITPLNLKTTDRKVGPTATLTFSTGCSGKARSVSLHIALLAQKIYTVDHRYHT